MTHQNGANISETELAYWHTGDSTYLSSTLTLTTRTVKEPSRERAIKAHSQKQRLNSWLTKLWELPENPEVKQR